MEQEQLILEKIKVANKRLDKMENLVEDLDKRMDKTERFTTRIETLFTGMEARFSSLESKIDRFIEKQEEKEKEERAAAEQHRRETMQREDNERTQSMLERIIMTVLKYLGIIITAIAGVLGALKLF